MLERQCGEQAGKFTCDVSGVSSREVGTENFPGNLGFRNLPFPGKFGVSKFPVCRDIYVGMPGYFFYISKDFRSTDIHHSDIKNAFAQI